MKNNLRQKTTQMELVGTWATPQDTSYFERSLCGCVYNRAVSPLVLSQKSCQNWAQ